MNMTTYDEGICPNCVPMDTHIAHIKAHEQVVEVIRMERLNLRFPEDKAKIARLSFDQKMEWYAHQIQVAAQTGQLAVGLTTKEFRSFWKWRVTIPMKFKRFFVRIKTGQIFKRYEHISQMKERIRKHGI